MRFKSRVSLQEEPLQDDLADVGVIGDLCVGFLVNIEEVGFEVVAQFEGFSVPSPEQRFLG